MKTVFSPETVSTFLASNYDSRPETLTQLTEGHVSQAYSFETPEGHQLVIRISARKDDFLADQFAHERFGRQLPIPKILEVDAFEGGNFYCVSEKVPGVISDELSQEEINNSLDDIHAVFIKVFTADISVNSGYGNIDPCTGNAPHASWQEAMRHSVEDNGLGAIHRSAEAIGLKKSLVEAYVKQFYDNLDFASEVRRLSHGDLGMDNLLMHEGQVTGLIDWAHIAYGDWLKDFAKMDFWWPGRFGDPLQFAKKHGLDMENFEQRKALYWAETALNSIWAADKFQIKPVINWFHEHGESRLIA